MHSTRTSRIVAIFTIAALMTATAEARPHRRAQKAQVRFLATSTLIRSTWFWNEDTYFAELIFPRSNESVLVRLVDAYPSEAPPLTRNVLTSDSGAVLTVRRDDQCDRPFGEIVLRTAPGDPMAVLPEKLVYQPHMERVPAREMILPCYRILRR